MKETTINMLWHPPFDPVARRRYDAFERAYQLSVKWNAPRFVYQDDFRGWRVTSDAPSCDVYWRVMGNNVVCFEKTGYDA